MIMTTLKSWVDSSRSEVFRGLKIMSSEGFEWVNHWVSKSFIDHYGYCTVLIRYTNPSSSGVFYHFKGQERFEYKVNPFFSGFFHKHAYVCACWCKYVIYDSFLQLSRSPLLSLRIHTYIHTHTCSPPEHTTYFRENTSLQSLLVDYYSWKSSRTVSLLGHYTDGPFPIACFFLARTFILPLCLPVTSTPFSLHRLHSCLPIGPLSNSTSRNVQSFRKSDLKLTN